MPPILFGARARSAFRQKVRVLLLRALRVGRARVSGARYARADRAREKSQIRMAPYLCLFSRILCARAQRACEHARGSVHGASARSPGACAKHRFRFGVRPEAHARVQCKNAHRKNRLFLRAPHPTPQPFFSGVRPEAHTVHIAPEAHEKI
jgi:hypothetical protein